MKTRTQTRNVTTHGIGETTSFSIATNGKAFRSLIDSVYTDKITTPIRELMTNAFDSHQAAGKGDEPFTVIVPSRQDMRFAVRDYGTGMDHETVTNLYTTLFASSKEDTNDEVGQLGLGSKSPFAYTDTFTVTAFDGTSKRVYTAFMASDLPQLALLHEGPSSDPQGILVEFPVKYEDVHDFQAKAAHVAIGFDVRPTIAGGTLDIPRPLSKGDGWSIFKAHGYGSAFSGRSYYVRQGCVIYPVPNSAIMSFPLDYDTAVVIDVPIGTAEVTLSREALSWDDETRNGVQEHAQRAWKDASRFHQEAYDALPTLVEKLRYRNDHIPRNWWGSMNVASGDNVPLLPGWGNLQTDAIKNAKPGEYVHLAQPTTSYGVKTTVIYGLGVNELDHVKIVLMDETTPRRVTRLRQWGRLGSNGSRYTANKFLYLPVEDQDEARKRIQEVWGLKNEQFIPVSSLPDVDREVIAKANPTAKTVLQELQEKLDDGALWVGTHSRKHEYLSLTNALTPAGGWEPAVTKMEQAFPILFDQVVGDNELVYLSRAQRDSLELDEKNELSNVMVKFIKDQAPAVVDQKTANAVYHAVTSLVRYEARQGVARALGLSTKQIDGLGSETLRGASLLGLNTAEDQGQIDRMTALVRNTFPLLFPLDQAEISSYIQKQAATLNQGDNQS